MPFPPHLAKPNSPYIYPQMILPNMVHLGDGDRPSLPGGVWEGDMDFVAAYGFRCPGLEEGKGFVRNQTVCEALCAVNEGVVVLNS